MYMSLDVEIKVRTFKPKAKKRVQEIDLSEYNLVNWTSAETLLICKDSVKAGEYYFAGLMEKIVEALNGEGMAYLIESGDYSSYVESYNYATTYYCQGNDVKRKYFESTPYDYKEKDEDFDNPLEALSALEKKCKEKRHESYIPRVEWADEEDFTDKEKELLEKYPW